MKIREVRPEDTARLLEIYAPYILDTAVTFETEIPSVEDFAGRIAGISAKYPWLVAEMDGRIVGYAYGSTHRARAAYQWTAEVSAYLSPEGLRKGVGRALYERLFEILRERGFVNVVAGMSVPNPASKAFHEAMGFGYIGTFHQVGFKQGEWHDTAWYELRLAELAVPPPAIRD